MIKNFNPQSGGKRRRKLNQRYNQALGLHATPYCRDGLIIILYLQSTQRLREALRAPALPVTKGEILYDSSYVRYLE